MCTGGQLSCRQLPPAALWCHPLLPGPGCGASFPPFTNASSLCQEAGTLSSWVGVMTNYWNQQEAPILALTFHVYGLVIW